MNTIVSSESAWQPAYDGIANADDTRVPQCTEGIMELVKGITGARQIHVVHVLYKLSLEGHIWSSDGRITKLL